MQNPPRVSLKETEEEKTQGLREEVFMTTEAGVGVMDLQAKESQGSRATTQSWERGRGWIGLQSHQKDATLKAGALISEFWPLEL